MLLWCFKPFVYSINFLRKLLLSREWKDNPDIKPWSNNHKFWIMEDCSVQFSRSVVSDSLPPHVLQHSRLPCPSPTPGVYLNSCPLSQWCHQPSHPLSSPSPPTSIFPSISESVLCIRWPTYWSFSFSISPSNEYSGLISFRIDWFDLLAVQETPKSLLQHYSSKASVLWRSAFFIVQLSYPSIHDHWKNHNFGGFLNNINTCIFGNFLII